MVASQSGTASTAATESTSSSKARSTSGYDNIDDFAHTSNKFFEKSATKDYEVWLISTPCNFPKEKLKDVPLVPNASSSVRVLERSEDGSKSEISRSYLCDSHVMESSKAIIIPGKDQSYFMCKKPYAHIQIKEDISLKVSDFANLIERPPPPTISEGLKERLKLIGVGDGAISQPSPSLGKPHKRKRKKNKASDDTDSPHKRKKEKKQKKKKKKHKKENND